MEKREDTEATEPMETLKLTAMGVRVELKHAPLAPCWFGISHAGAAHI